MFANTQRGGLDHAFADVCLNPDAIEAQPVPYPNVSRGAMGVPAVYNVLLSGAPAHNLSTAILLSDGDVEQNALGVVSRTNLGPSRHVTGATSVLIGGMPATRLGSLSLQNTGNTVGARISPSQTKVLLLAR